MDASAGREAAAAGGAPVAWAAPAAVARRGRLRAAARAATQQLSPAGQAAWWHPPTHRRQARRRSRRRRARRPARLQAQRAAQRTQQRALLTHPLPRRLQQRAARSAAGPRPRRAPPQRPSTALRNGAWLWAGPALFVAPVQLSGSKAACLLVHLGGRDADVGCDDAARSAGGASAAQQRSRLAARSAQSLRNAPARRCRRADAAHRPGG